MRGIGNAAIAAIIKIPEAHPVLVVGELLSANRKRSPPDVAACTLRRVVVKLRRTQPWPTPGSPMSLAKLRT
jgi:hypothetical protein